LTGSAARAVVAAAVKMTAHNATSIRRIKRIAVFPINFAIGYIFK